MKFFMFALPQYLCLPHVTRWLLRGREPNLQNHMTFWLWGHMTKKLCASATSVASKLGRFMSWVGWLMVFSHFWTPPTQLWALPHTWANPLSHAHFVAQFISPPGDSETLSPFHTTCSLKHQKTSGVLSFREYMKRPVSWNGLNIVNKYVSRYSCLFHNSIFFLIADLQCTQGIWTFNVFWLKVVLILITDFGHFAKRSL